MKGGSLQNASTLHRGGQTWSQCCLTAEQKSSSYQQVGRFCNSLMLVMNPLKSCTHAGIDFDPTPERTPSFTHILPWFVSLSLITFFASSISGESFFRQLFQLFHHNPGNSHLGQQWPLCAVSQHLFFPGKKIKGRLTRNQYSHGWCRETHLTLKIKLCLLQISLHLSHEENRRHKKRQPWMSRDQRCHHFVCSQVLLGSIKINMGSHMIGDLFQVPRLFLSAVCVITRPCLFLRWMRSWPLWVSWNVLRHAPAVSPEVSVKDWPSRSSWSTILLSCSLMSPPGRICLT